MNTDKQPSVLDKPIYNIGAVERMTGIPVATLRVWERRYDFPTVERTEGGHRLYSENTVRQLQWVKARLDEGMQIRQAVQALKYSTPALEVPSIAPAPVSAPPPALATAQEQLVATLLRGAHNEAGQLLGNLLALYSLEDLLLGVINPTLEAIGAAWQTGEISVAQEHAASQYLKHRLIMWMQTGPQPRDSAPVLLTCAPEEWHEISLLMLGVMLRRRRWPMVYLGQATPLRDLAAYVRDNRAAAIVAIAMTEATAQHLQPWPQWMPEIAESGQPPFTYAGRIFTQQPEWRARMPGIFLGATLQEGVNTLERLLLR